jgi:hypothetical protein
VTPHSEAIISIAPTLSITVRGWGRDQGEKVLMDAWLPSVERELSNGRFSRHTTYLRVYPDNSRTTALVSTHAEMRLGGDYLLQVELRRDEIAKLFFETHGGDIVRMFQSFIEDEERAKKQKRLQEIIAMRNNEQSV